MLAGLLEAEEARLLIPDECSSSTPNNSDDDDDDDEGVSRPATSFFGFVQLPLSRGGVGGTGTGIVTD
jgi:hypothetical protein